MRLTCVPRTFFRDLSCFSSSATELENLTSLSATTSVLSGSESEARVMADMMLTSTAHRSAALAVAKLVSPSTVLHSDLSVAR